MIVVDASALVAFFLREEGWESLAPYMTRVVSVDLAVKEFYNAVWKAARLLRRLSMDDVGAVIALFRQYLSRNMELRDESRYVDEALEIALSRGVTVYDALYIALARDEGLPLLSLDEKQRAAARACGVEPLP